MKTKLIIMLLFAMAIFSSSVFAGTGFIYVQIKRLSIIPVAIAGHLAGNMEVTVKDAFQLPTGVVCDTTYITTKKGIDLKNQMFALLLTAHITQQTVELGITDDPQYTAYPNRCSLLMVNMY